MSFVSSIFNLLRFNRKNWKAVVLCIFAATVFWFFNALNKSYTANINFPLAFDFSETNYLAVRPLPDEIRINVTGIGWNLLRRSAGVKSPPLVVPLERPSEVRKIVASTLPALFSNQLDGIQINFVVTDTLYLSIQPKARRRIKLSADTLATRNIRNGFRVVSDVSIEPDSVYIEGPLNTVIAIHEPLQLKMREENVENNFSDRVRVIFPAENIRITPSEVSLSFAVEEVVPVPDSVTLEVINIPQKVRALIEVRKVPCVFSVPKNQIRQFSADSVRAVLDLKGFVKGEIKSVPTLYGLPKYVTVTKIDSIRVKLGR